MRSYFPDPAFAWLFVGVLFALTAVMAVIDLRTATIPKKLTLATLGLGVVAHLLRCALLAHDGRPLVFLGTGNIWLGALEGLLYAGIAAVVSFAIMFVLWIMGVCGGGDVKLMTGVGAWVGVVLVGQVILVSIMVVGAFLVFRIVTGQVRLTEVQRMKRPDSPLAKKTSRQSPIKPGRLRTTYSLPICVATTIVVLFTFRAELGLEHQPPARPTSQVQSNESN